MRAQEFITERRRGKSKKSRKSARAYGPFWGWWGGTVGSGEAGGEGGGVEEGLDDERVTEIIQMPSIKRERQINIHKMYRDSLAEVKNNQARKLIGLDIGVKNVVYRGDNGIYKIYVFDDKNEPVYYAGMSPYYDGLRTGAVAGEPQARGKGLGWRIYDAMSRRFNTDLYSDDVQTDDSRIGIWQQLISKFPGRVVIYDQVKRQDLPLTKENLAGVYQQLPPEQARDVESPTRKNTLLLKLLPQ